MDTGSQGMGARKSMILVLTVLLILFLAPPLHAQDSYREFERGLNLSDSQRTQAEAIKRKYIDEWHALKKESIKKRLELRDAYRNPSDDGGKAEAIQEEIRTIEQSRENLYNRYRSEVSRLLTPEQKGKYNSFSNSERRKHIRPPLMGPSPMGPLPMRNHGR
jgi:Spy/CpxP family protein refolding chaperone